MVPGDVLADSDSMRPGDNTYVLNGKIRSNMMGVKTLRNDFVGVIPMNECYMPRTGDMVIGTIIDIGPSNWLMDINAPYPAPLRVNEVPWKVEFGDTSKFLKIGDTVLLKILMVDESKKIQVTMRDSGLRKIEGGLLVEITHSKVSRVIGKSGSMIQMLKDKTDCRIFVGQNGRIWIDGDEENADVAAEAIRYIENHTRSGNLMEKVESLIEAKLPENGDDKEESYEEEDE